MRFHKFNYCLAPRIVLSALCYLVCFVEICFVFFQEIVIEITVSQIRLIGSRVLFHKAFSYPYSSKIIFLCFFGLSLIAIENTRIVITIRKIRFIGIGVLFRKAFSYLYRGEIVFLCFVGLAVIAIKIARIVITLRKHRCTRGTNKIK